ncbi:hypothetical protein CI109_102425 [Kwoniella shandongensis]|uniref:Uncharacterized protein n=1 Tax=Kwoniella shandongensis TaxID=1734106 RepID=A0A5M6BZQ1_9TREE|nr:uncharacterized protein CI109_003256 [Kwoniella shandongensis]KAA5528357.1 hypothetical protein CI109_003256 [Kwoniella shandongensis]
MAISPPPEPTDVGKRAWVTLVTNPSYLAGLLTLHRTLTSVSSYPLVVMTTPTLPPSSQALIESYGIPTRSVPHLSPSSSQNHPGFDPSFVRFADTWTKLRAFGLTEFEKIVLIDVDMIFTRSGMDELFDMALPGEDWIAAAPACVCNPFKLEHYPKDWIPANCLFQNQSTHSTLSSLPPSSPSAPRTAHLLNGGLVVLHPSRATFDDILDHLNNSPQVPDYKFPDQDLLAEVFKGKWKPLPWWCNALKTLRAVHKDIWRDEEVRLIHYILDKPWNKRPASLPAYTDTINQLPLTPISPDGSTNGPPRRPLPRGLLDSVKSAAPQESLRDYEEVHKWWWIVYEDLLDEMKTRGDERWKEVDQWVKR